MNSKAKINWSDKKTEKKFAEIGLKEFIDFWEFETNKASIKFKPMGKHIDKKTGAINRQMIQFSVNEEIFYLKRTQGVSYECVKNEYEAAKIIPNFGLHCADLIMHAFDDQNRKGFIVFRNLNGFYCLNNMKERDVPEEVVSFFLSNKHDFFSRISRIIYNIHNAGYYFPDWHAKHIFIKKDSDEIALIDLERFLPLEKWPWYYSFWIVFYFRKLKVWRKLRCSLESELFSKEDLRSYFC